jgi:hypothetical protein
MSAWSGAHFIFYGIIEIALTLLVIVYAWTWPRANNGTYDPPQAG